MRVCIYLDADENMSDKCECAIIFIGAHYRSVLRLRTVCNSYIELLGALDFLLSQGFLLTAVLVLILRDCNNQRNFVWNFAGYCNHAKRYVIAH